MSQDNKSVNLILGPEMLNWFYYILFVLVFILGGCSSTPTNIQIQPQSKVSDSPNPEALKYFMEGQLYINQGKYAMA